MMSAESDTVFRFHPAMGKTHFQFVLVGIVALLCLAPRFHGEYFSGKYLWAEDGAVFVNAAEAHGFRSILLQAAGYLHLYPRLVGLLASQFDLAYTPEIFLAGWLVAFGALSLVIFERAIALGVPLPAALSLVALVALQPNSGEVFFSPTNSQWISGAALTVYLLTLVERPRKLGLPGYLALTIAGLTGPFVILAAPLLLLSGWLHRSINGNKAVFGIVLLCALTQFVALVASVRWGRQFNTLPADYAVWAKTIVSFASFGARDFATFTAAALFWLIFLWSLLYALKSRSIESASRRRCALFLFAGALVFIAVTFLPSANAVPVHTWGVWGGGYRYTWIPYTLFFASAVIATTGLRVAQTAICLVGGFICLSWPHSMPTANSGNLQFAAFSKFAKVRSVRIPIHPQGPVFYRGVYIHSTRSLREEDGVMQQYPLVAAEFTGDGLSVEQIGRALRILAADKNSALILKRPIACANSTAIGLEVDMNRSVAGFMEVSYAAESPDRKTSLRRFYPAGSITAQFALPDPGKGIQLQFQPFDRQGTATIHDLRIYCLT